jgi:hypothetical protein
MTKADMLTAWARWNNVADLHLTICDNDPVDQQFDQLALLLKRGLLKSCLHSLAKCLDRQLEGGQFLLAIHLRRQLLFLEREGGKLLLQILTPALILP